MGETDGEVLQRSTGAEDKQPADARTFPPAASRLCHAKCHPEVVISQVEHVGKGQSPLALI